MANSTPSPLTVAPTTPWGAGAMTPAQFAASTPDKNSTNFGGTGAAPTPAPNNFSLSATRYDASGKQTSPTVVTNAGIVEKTIPENNQKLTTLTNNRGATTGADGVTRNANGTVNSQPDTTDTSSGNTTSEKTATFGIDTGSMPTGEIKQVKDANGVTYSIDSNGQIVSSSDHVNGQYQAGGNISQYPDLYKTVTGSDIPTVGSSSTTSGLTGDPVSDGILAKMDALVATGDARTASTIQNIQSQYAALINKQQEVNRQQEGSITQSLLTSGSARYAQISSSGVLKSVVDNGIEKISSLVAQENDLINKAQAAQDDQDYKALNDRLAEYDKVRTAKDAAASKLNDALIKANKDAQDKKIQASRDNAIAGLMAQGVTDPKQMLDYLNLDDKGNSTGGDFTAKEISDSMKALETASGSSDLTGDMKEYFALKQSGIPLPASISALPASQQPFAYVKYKADLTRKDTTAAGVKDYAFSNDQKGKLIGTGLSTDQVEHLQQGINDYGVNEVLQKETGLTPDQKSVITELVTGKAKQFLDANWIKNNFDADKLRAAAKNAGDVTGGFWGMGQQGDVSTFSDALMETVNAYRDAGLSDKDILTKLEAKIK